MSTKIRNLMIVVEYSGKRIPIEEVDSTVTVDELLKALSPKIGLEPSARGVLVRKLTHKQLLNHQTLEDSQIEDNETLIADFERTAGGSQTKNFFIIYQNLKLPIQKAVEEISVDDLVIATIQRLNLPTQDERNNTLKYKLILRRTGKILPDISTLAGAGIQSDDELELVAEIVTKTDLPNQNITKGIIDDLRFSAPIRIPNREKLAVPLVPSDVIYRLEEHRSDQMRWESVMWIFIGAILGIVINWVTGDPITVSKTSLILIGFFILMALLLWGAVRDFKSRADKIKDEMLKLNDVEKK